MRQFNRAGGWLLPLLVAAISLRLAAALWMNGPWLLPDEGAYSLGYAHGIYQWVARLPYGVLRGLQAALACMTGVVVFAWARRLVSAQWAVAAAAMTLALPGLSYAGLIVPVAVFVPLATLTGLAGMRTLEEPKLRNQAGFAVLLALCTCVIGTANVIGLALFVAAVVVGRVRVLWPVWVAAAWIWTTSVALTGPAPIRSLGGGTGSYSLARVVDFILEHASFVLLLGGVLPVCAVVLLALTRPTGLVVRATITYSLVLALAGVVEVGVFAAGHTGRLLERELVFVLPPLFVGFTAWLDRGAPRPRLRTVTVAVCAVAVLLAVPFGRLAVGGAAGDNPSLVPLSHLSTARVYGVVALIALVAGVLLLFVRVRWIWVLPGLVFAVLAAASVSASEEFSDRSQAARDLYAPATATWIDDAATGPVTFLYDGQSDWQLAWEQRFWNDRITSVLDLAGTQVPGTLPQRQLELLGKHGLLEFVGGGKPAAGLIAAPQGFQFFGRLIARNQKIGFSLWQVDAPPRVSTWVQGLQPNGDLLQGGVATLTVFDCGEGSFHVVAVGRDNETVTLSQNGKQIAQTKLWPQGIWEKTVPTSDDLTPSIYGFSCTLTVQTTSLVHLSSFTWSPS